MDKSVKLFKAAIAASLVAVLMSKSAFAAEPFPDVDYDLVEMVRATHPSKADVIKAFGDPAKEEEIREQSSGKVVATILHYKNITKSPDGTYYPVTEFDFVNDSLESVVFLGSSPL